MQKAQCKADCVKIIANIDFTENDAKINFFLQVFEWMPASTCGPIIFKICTLE